MNLQGNLIVNHHHFPCFCAARFTPAIWSRVLPQDGKVQGLTGSLSTINLPSPPRLMVEVVWDKMSPSQRLLETSAWNGSQPKTYPFQAKHVQHQIELLVLLLRFPVLFCLLYHSVRWQMPQVEAEISEPTWTNQPLMETTEPTGGKPKRPWRCDTVDGPEIRRSPVDMVVYPYICRVLYIPTGAGVLNHQQ